mgnify:CR=1 FL=1
MNEHGFVQAIHRRLSNDVYAWKINARFARGIPDAWYSGPGGDVWVEYKFLPSHPKRASQIGLSANQRHWLDQRYKEGRNLAVIVGTPEGAFLLTDGHWGEPLAADAKTTDYKGVAAWIEQQTLST